MLYKTSLNSGIIHGELMKIIRDTLLQMIKSNQRVTCDLEGGAFYANFEVPHKGEPWVQAKIGVINLYFPFDRPPNVVFNELGLDDIPSIAFPAWGSQKFATISFDALSVDDYSSFIDSIFRRLYMLPDGYIVDTDIFDMR